MILTRKLIRHLATISLLTISSALSTSVSSSTIYRFDTDGNAIDSTSGKIDYLGGSYLWYGLNFGCGKAFCGIQSWSSPDLVSWKSNGLLFNPNATEFLELCENAGDCGRPHIVYSAATKQYVLWVNAGAPGYPVLTSSSPTGPYTLQSRAAIGYSPPASQGGDFSVAVINGTGYLAWSSIDFTNVGSASIWPPFTQSIYIQQLTPDMMNTTGSAYPVAPIGDLVDFEAESPDIFKRGDYFYVTASNTCGFCTGTLLIVYRSKSIQGPWTRQIISSDTCGSQSTGVLTLPCPTGGEATYLHQSDVFSSAPLTGARTASHGHLFQALAFNTDGSVKDFACNPKAVSTITIVPGNSTLPSTPKQDASTTTAPYNASCDIPHNALYQTWQASQSGTLKTVGVNLGTIYQTANITLTVFRFQNNSNFFTPRYTWETLATKNFVPGEISASLLLRNVDVGKTVAKSDRLGVAVVSSSLTPVCYLKTFSAAADDTCTSSGSTSLPALGSGISEAAWGAENEEKQTRTLFVNAINQVSYRGKDGKTPPVRVAAGEEIKWIAVYA